MLYSPANQAYLRCTGAARLLAALDGRAFAFLCCGRKKYTFACLCGRIVFALCSHGASLNDLLHSTVNHDPLSPVLELGDLCFQAPQSSLLSPYNGLPALIFLDLHIRNGLTVLQAVLKRQIVLREEHQACVNTFRVKHQHVLERISTMIGTIFADP